MGKYNCKLKRSRYVFEGIEDEREEEYLQYAIHHVDGIYDSGDLGTFTELKERIETFEPHIVHLSGHGIVGTDGVGYFAFEDDEGKTDRKSSYAMRNIFAKYGVQCVFVSGCQSGHAPPIEAINGVCQNLTHDGVPFAIGWAASISDNYATDFAREFYQHVGCGHTVDQSVSLARLKLWNLMKEEGNISWLLPVLYTASHQKTLYDPTKSEEKKFRDIKPLEPLSGMNEGYTSHFVGRRREQQHIIPNLISGKSRGVILTGMGGTGKSALATKIARKLQDFYQYQTLGGYRVTRNQLLVQTFKSEDVQ